MYKKSKSVRIDALLLVRRLIVHGAIVCLRRFTQLEPRADGGYLFVLPRRKSWHHAACAIHVGRSVILSCWGQLVGITAGVTPPAASVSCLFLFILQTGRARGGFIPCTLVSGPAEMKRKQNSCCCRAHSWNRSVCVLMMSSPPFMLQSMLLNHARHAAICMEGIPKRVELVNSQTEKKAFGLHICSARSRNS